LAIRVMVETMPPLLSSGLRFAVAGALLGGWLVARRGWDALRMTRRQLAGAAMVGALLMLGGNGLVSVGEGAGVPSGLAALLIASEPLMVIVLRFVSRDRVPRGTLVGVVVGFAGVAVLLLPGVPAGADALGVVAVLFAAVMWATGSFSITKLSTPADPLASTATQMLCGGTLMFLVGLLAGEAGDVHFSAFSGDSIIAFLYLVVVGSIVAFTAYTWLLRNVPISKVSTYAYVNPVIAVALGWAVLDESLSGVALLGAAIIVASVAGIVRLEGEAEPDIDPETGGPVSLELDPRVAVEPEAGEPSPEVGRP
jgi:drug/metabolite transporter (DMT)-like permease